LFRNLDEIDARRPGKWMRVDQHRHCLSRCTDHAGHTTPYEVLKKWLGNEKTVWERHLVGITKAENLLSRSTPEISWGRQWDVDESILAVCDYLPQLLVSGCK